MLHQKCSVSDWLALLRKELGCLLSHSPYTTISVTFHANKRVQHFECLPGETVWRCAPQLSPAVNNIASPPLWLQAFHPAFKCGCAEQVLTLLILHAVWPSSDRAALTVLTLSTGFKQTMKACLVPGQSRKWHSKHSGIWAPWDQFDTGPLYKPGPQADGQQYSNNVEAVLVMAANSKLLYLYSTFTEAHYNLYLIHTLR